MSGFYLSADAVVFLCQFVLAAAISVYLFSVRQKSRATWWLAISMAAHTLFLGCLVVLTSMSATAATLLDVFQLLTFLVGLTAALGFAYYFLAIPYPREARWAVVIAGMLSLGWPLFLGVAMVAQLALDAQFVNVAIAVTVLLLSLWTFVVHMRKTAYLSASADESVGWIRSLIRPVGRPARAHRAFGLLSLLILIVAVLIGLAGTGLAPDDFANTVILAGFLAYVLAVVIIYVNHAPEPTTFQVKIISFALATVVAVLGLTTLLIYNRVDLSRASDVELPSTSMRFVPAEGGGYRILETNEPLDPELGDELEMWNGAHVAVATGFPFPFAGVRWDSLEVDDDGLVSFGGGFSVLSEFSDTELSMIAPYFASLLPERGGGIYVRRTPSSMTVTWHEVPHSLAYEHVTAQLVLDSTGTVEFRYGPIPTTAMEAVRGLFPDGNTASTERLLSHQSLPAALEPGAPFAQDFGEEYRAFVHDRVVVMAWIVLGSTLFILLIFPFLLRSVTRRINGLLEGVRRVNAGDLNTKVRVTVHDEIGYLGRNFNQMTESLKTAEEQLRGYAQELEQRVETRTAELRRSLEELRSAQQQLVQQEKLASLGQLTAGIAHEIKNPLNFVNNFAALSIELAEELSEELADRRAALGGGAEEVEELIESIKMNAAKIREHGRRADGIVKSMLLHSRGRPRERQETDLNALLDEYVNLAYHGMRAQDAEFNCRIERDLDDEVGRLDVVPQDIGRVFINLLNNAFYAVKEKAKARDGSFEPAVAVSTRRVDGNVVVRITDNGPGIPDALRRRIFEPFYTTKPTGSGTGLGLSLSYDIITQEHAGDLAVESVPGENTSFIITLPVGSNGRDPSTL